MKRLAAILGLAAVLGLSCLAPLAALAGAPEGSTEGPFQHEACSADTPQEPAAPAQPDYEVRIASTDTPLDISSLNTYASQVELAVGPYALAEASFGDARFLVNPDWFLAFSQGGDEPVCLFVGDAVTLWVQTFPGPGVPAGEENATAWEQNLARTWDGYMQNRQADFASFECDLFDDCTLSSYAGQLKASGTYSAQSDDGPQTCVVTMVQNQDACYLFELTVYPDALAGEDAGFELALEQIVASFRVNGPIALDWRNVYGPDFDDCRRANQEYVSYPVPRGWEYSGTRSDDGMTSAVYQGQTSRLTVTFLNSPCTQTEQYVQETVDALSQQCGATLETTAVANAAINGQHVVYLQLASDTNAFFVAFVFGSGYTATAVAEYGPDPAEYLWLERAIVGLVPYK